MIWKHTATALCAGALLSDCAASQQARDVQTSGFPGEDDEALLVYRAPNANWAAYDKIKLDPVTIWVGEDSASTSSPLPWWIDSPGKRRAPAV